MSRIARSSSTTRIFFCVIVELADEWNAVIRFAQYYSLVKHCVARPCAHANKQAKRRLAVLRGRPQGRALLAETDPAPTVAAPPARAWRLPVWVRADPGSGPRIPSRPPPSPRP